MADDENKVDEQDEKQQPESDDSQAEDKQEQEDWWAEAQKRGFKSKDEIWKSYREAEKKISTQGEELSKARYFQEQVSPILDVAWKDDVILNRLRSNLSSGADGKGQPSSDDNKNTGSEQTQRGQQPQVDVEARAALVSQTVGQFESSKGLDTLDDESRRDVRQKIGQQAAKWVGDLRTVPPGQLPSLLEDAFAVVSQRDESLKKMLDSSSSNKKTEDGAMPSASSGSGSEKEGDVKLTPEQMKVAERMGGSEAYKKGLKKLMGK